MRPATLPESSVLKRNYDGGVTVSQDELAEAFSTHRSHLIGVAYRLTSTLSDAEDAVQEAWLRLSTLEYSQRAAIRDLRAWLTTVVGHICLDRLRSAAVRRERYVGPWLPEPVVTPFGGAPSDDPLDTVVRDDDMRMAAMVVLDRLTPEQRVAFVLHDAFAVPFAEIAAILDCSEAAARQHASRGRRAAADADPPPRAALDEQRALIERFLAAVAAGDVAAVVEVLHPDAVLIGDSDGKVPTARRMISGAEKIARFLLGLAERYGTQAISAGRLVLVNGDLGMAMPDVPADGEHRALSRRVGTFAIRDGRVAAVYDIVNPDKLTRVRW
jgi:RNA polymerase sigma-70 factor (ECF subfamily)